MRRCRFSGEKDSAGHPRGEGSLTYTNGDRFEVLRIFFNSLVISAQRVRFFTIGSGRVMEKIPGSGSGSGRVGVLKIRSGIFGYLFYSRVIPGIPGIFG